MLTNLNIQDCDKLIVTGGCGDNRKTGKTAAEESDKLFLFSVN